MHEKTYPAGYANIPLVNDTSSPALLHTVNPITFLSFICEVKEREKFYE